MIVHCLVNNIPGIEEVNMIKDDGTVIHFNNPKVRFHISSYFNCQKLETIRRKGICSVNLLT